MHHPLHRPRRLRAALAALVVAGPLVLTAQPAHAALLATATSVALSAGSGCTSPVGLDLGMVTEDVERETGVASSETGVLMSFDQASGLSNFTGVITGYNYASPAFSVDPGELLGLYATVGAATPTPETTAEWFLLYRCPDGETGSEVLETCFGPYGSCPTTVQEAIAEPPPSPPVTRPPGGTVPTTVPSTTVPTTSTTSTPPPTVPPTVTSVVPPTTAPPTSVPAPTTTAPGGGVGAAPAARPVAAQPSYTG